MKKTKLLEVLLLLSISSTALGKAFIDDGQPVSNLTKAPFNSVVLVVFKQHTPAGYLATYSCTGTFIATNKILTAGHCAVNDDGTTIKPDHYTIQRAMDGRTYPVERVDTPFSPAKGLKNDFAVLTVDNNDTSTPIAELANTTKSELLKKHPVLIDVGYGIDLFKNSHGRLQQGKVYPTTDDYASQTIANGNAWFLSKGIPLGAVYQPEGVFATCSDQSADHGDSGGPVFEKIGNRFYQVGTTSWGLTILDNRAGRYLAYSKCIGFDGVEAENSRVSVFTSVMADSPVQSEIKSIL